MLITPAVLHLSPESIFAGGIIIKSSSMDAPYSILDNILQCNPFILEDVKYLSTKLILIYAGLFKRLIFHTLHTFRGSIFIFEITIGFTFPTLLITYLSILRCLSVLSTIVQKGGDYWCNSLPLVFWRLLSEIVWD
jgi:hypothetical protein